MPEGYEEARAILRGEPLFQCLSDDQIENLVKQSELNHFGRGERVIEEGAEGDSMFILLRGDGPGFGCEKWIDNSGGDIALGRLLWRDVAVNRREAERDGARGR